MSVRVMSLVWEADLPPMEKLVLLALADCANDEGTCWPSASTLLRKSGQSERTVRRCIKTLTEKGHLTQQKRTGTSSVFRVHPCQTDTPATVAPLSDSPVTPVTVAPKPLRTIKPSEAKASSGRARGCRLPDDWEPDETDILFAKGVGHGDERIRDIADAFRDYWKAQPGQRGVKLDWSATWRNWVRREAQRPAPIQRKQYTSKTGYVYRGDRDAVRREAERRADWDTYWQVQGDDARSIGDVTGAILKRAANG